MEKFWKAWFWGKQLASLNQCQMWLQVITISEIMDGMGSFILMDFLYGKSKKIYLSNLSYGPKLSNLGITFGVYGNRLHDVYFQFLYQSCINLWGIGLLIIPCGCGYGWLGINDYYNMVQMVGKYGYQIGNIVFREYNFVKLIPGSSQLIRQQNWLVLRNVHLLSFLVVPNHMLPREKQMNWTLLPFMQ